MVIALHQPCLTEKSKGNGGKTVFVLFGGIRVNQNHTTVNLAEFFLKTHQD